MSKNTLRLAILNGRRDIVSHLVERGVQLDKEMEELYSIMMSENLTTLDRFRMFVPEETWPNLECLE